VCFEIDLKKGEDVEKGYFENLENVGYNYLVCGYTFSILERQK